MTKHLDLGCGTQPKNPFKAHFLFGVDIRDFNSPNVIVKKANLAVEKIPYDDNFFDSVSAYDFLEHIPRVIHFQDGHIVFPFVNLMSEIHRVLKPGGVFWARTPVYPALEVFQDPTHVNFITRDTHKYFCGESPDANIYGFQGRFYCREIFYSNNSGESSEVFPGRIKNVFQKLSFKKMSHIVWSLEAIKN